MKKGIAVITIVIIMITGFTVMAFQDTGNIHKGATPELSDANVSYLIVKNISEPHKLVEYHSGTLQIKLLNTNSTSSINHYNLSLDIRGKVYTQSYNSPINASSNKTVNFTFTPTVSGKPTVSVTPYYNTTPPSKANIQSNTAAITIAVDPEKTYTAIGAMIASVVLIFGAFYVITKHRNTAKKSLKEINRGNELEKHKKS